MSRRRSGYPRGSAMNGNSNYVYNEIKNYVEYLANDKEYDWVLNRIPTPEQIKRLPKVLLHDHLDGGLRPSTIIDIAKRIGYELPTYDPDELEEWFFKASNSGSLVRYLETFKHTDAVMQETPDLIRIAKECVLDLAYDNVIYAEVRFAPELHTEKGLTLDEVIDSVLEGLREGMKQAAADGYPIRAELILCSLRQFNYQQIIAEKCVKYRDRGVIGFDIAGPEQGYPPAEHLETFNYLRQENFHFTIHAGEAFGIPSIWQAIQFCGAERLGHGVRIMDDIQLLSDSYSLADRPDNNDNDQSNYDDQDNLDDLEPPKPLAKLGRLASYLKDCRIPFECCPTSNLQIGVVKDIRDHPIGPLMDLNFRVTINTDNRLVSATSMTKEMCQVVEAFNWGFLHLERMTINAVKSSFIPFDDRLHLIERIIKPRFYQIAAESASMKLRSLELPNLPPDTY